jgi:mRNA interferase MazF
MSIKRGKIYLANLDPTIGAEMKKTRPVIIVSNDINNKYNLTVTVLPITSTVAKIFPFEVYLSKGTGNLPKDSKIKADQIRTIDKRRLSKEIGELPENKMVEIDQAIKIHLALK